MKKTKIALLEDDEILSKVIKEELEESGFEVDRAADGESGLKIIEKEKPDLVLLDVMMPKMGGFEVLEKMKNSLSIKDIPVIMLTMLGSDDDIKKGLKLGATDYIVKSQHAVAEIVEKIQEFFGKESHPEAHQSAADYQAGDSNKKEEKQNDPQQDKARETEVESEEE